MTNIPVGAGELVDVGYLNEVARAHYRKVTSKQVLNTITETDLLNGEITIGAGAMGVNRAIRLTARGDWLQNSAAVRDVPRFKLKLGATVLLDTNITGATCAGPFAGRLPWRFDCLIQNLGATNAQWSSMAGLLQIAAGTTFGAAVFATGEGQSQTIARNATQTASFGMEGSNSSAVDTTLANLLALSVILPTATATIDVTLTHALVEIV